MIRPQGVRNDRLSERGDRNRPKNKKEYEKDKQAKCSEFIISGVKTERKVHVGSDIV